MSGKVLVLGATGTIGGKVASLLVEKGEQVKAVSRNATPVAGAEPVALDLTSPSSLDAALDGVDRVFANVPAGYLDPVGLLSPVIDAAAARKIKVVLMTVLGVDADDSIPYRQLELKLEKAGIPYGIIRPNWFADNFHTYWREGVRHGVIGVPAAEGKSSFIDTRDIAESAVALLTSSRFDGKAYNLTGPEALGYGEAAKILSEVTGKQIAYQALADEDFITTLIGAGVPEDYARFLAMIFHPVREGWTAGVSPDVETLTGKPPRTLRTYAEDNKALLVD
jgi:uncharacterized protein YbjT (DUF2867 family)